MGHASLGTALLVVVIAERIGKMAYRCDLLLHTALHGVHNVFHVLLLHDWQSNGVHSIC